MEEGNDVRDYLNKFNKLITQLASVDVRVEDEDKAFQLITFLPPSYKSLVIALIVERETLKVEEVTTVLLDDDKFKKRDNTSKGEVFVAGHSYDRSNPLENNQRRNSRSNSRPPIDLEDR